MAGWQDAPLAPEEQSQPAWRSAPLAAPTASDTLMDVARQGISGFNTGVDNLLNLPGDVLRAGASAVGLGDYAPQRGRLFSLFNPGQALGPSSSPEARTTAGRYAHTVGEAVGASAIPTAATVALAPRLASMAATTLPRAIGQRLGETVASSPVAAVGVDLAAATGSGLAQQGAEDAGAGAIGQTLAGLAGGMAPLALGGAVSRGTRAVEQARASADPYARIAAGLGDTSVDDLATAAAVGTTRQSERISRRAFDILGEEMARPGATRQTAIPAALARIEADGVAPATAREHLRRLTNAQQDSDLLLGEFPAVAESNLATRMRQPRNVLDEDAAATTEPGTQRLIDYVANTGTMASSQGVRNAITRRAADLADHTRAVVQSLSPGGQSIQDVEGMIQALQRRASAAYDTAHSGGVNYPLFYGLLDRYIPRHLNRAYGRSDDQAQALREAINRLFVSQSPGADASRRMLPGVQDDLAAAQNALREARRQGQPRGVLDNMSREVDRIRENLRLTRRDTTLDNQQLLRPSLQMAQDARGGIRGQIQAARQSGRNDIAAILQPLYDDVTRAMGRASPQWRNANRMYADMRLDEVAAELGEAFTRTPGPRARQQLRDFQALAPEAQDVVRVHFVQQLLDRVEGQARLGRQMDLGRLFSRDHDRRMIRTILGDEAAVTVARLIRDAGVMARSRNMLAGSPTHIRGQTQMEQDADIRAVTAAANFDWRNWRAEALERLTALWRERRNRTVGRVITTPMRDVPAVAGEVERIRRASERVAAANRRPIDTPALTRPGVWAPALNAMLNE